MGTGKTFCLVLVLVAGAAFADETVTVTVDEIDEVIVDGKHFVFYKNGDKFTGILIKENISYSYKNSYRHGPAASIHTGELAESFVSITYYYDNGEKVGYCTHSELKELKNYCSRRQVKQEY